MSKSLILLEKSYDVELRKSFSTETIIFRILMFVALIFTVSTIIEALGEIGTMITIISISALVEYIFFKVNYQRQTEIIEKRKKGFIRIKDNQLEIKYNNKFVSIEKNQSLEFRYFNYHGESEGRAGRHIGTRNYLKFNNDTADVFFIYVPNSKDIKTYEEIIKWCLENGMQVKEYHNGERVHGGKKLKYKELQKFKEKYNQV